MEDPPRAAAAPTPATRVFGLDHPLGRVLAGLAALNLFAMMALTLVDVVGRYVFNAPLPGAFEMTEMMMGISVFAILPFITARDEHITIELVDRFFKGTLRRIKEAVVAAISALFVALILWRVWQEARKHAEYGDATAYLGIPVAPFVFFMAVMAALTLAALCALAWDRARGVARQASAVDGTV